MLAFLCHFEIGVGVPSLVGYFVRQNIIFASGKRSRVIEGLVASAPSTWCDGRWRFDIGDGHGGGPGQVKGRDLPRMYGPHWEIVGLVSRRLIVRPSLCTRD